MRRLGRCSGPEKLDLDFRAAMETQAAGLTEGLLSTHAMQDVVAKLNRALSWRRSRDC